MSQPQSTSSTKYRPVLTSAQILHILCLAKSEQPHISLESMGLIAVLAPFQAKIENAGVVAAYTTVPEKPKANSLEALGSFSREKSDTATRGNKELYWKQCYEKVTEHGPAQCSLQEIEAANEHRYINDLMSPQEEEQYELCNNPENK